MTVLTTERLILTPPAVADFADLCVQFGNEAFTRHIFPAPLTPEEVWFRLLRDIGHWEALGHGNWVVRLRDGGDYVGGVGVLDYHRDLDPPFGAPELGWGVAPRFEGRGFAFEAVSAAVAWCDDALNAPRTVCMIDPANTRSLALAARAGYRPYGEGVYKGEINVLLERRAA